MNSNLGNKVRLLRKKRKLRQDDLGKILNLSRSQISNLESGKRNFNLQQIKKLCNYFKIDMSYFFMEETTASCLDLLDKVKLLFESKELTNSQKDDLFSSIMKIYIESKEEFDER